MAVWWTNRSRLPSSGVMKPKPFSSLNHFTVPVGMVLYPSSPCEPHTQRLVIGGDRSMPRMRASGGGWATAGLDELGDGYGFRKVRSQLGVEAFGINAIVMPPGIETGVHWHDEQDEVYFVHAGRIEMTFGDGSSQELAAGSFAHVRAPVQRRIKNIGDTDAIYVIVGGKGGYVGRDGRAPEGTQRVQASS